MDWGGEGRGEGQWPANAASPGFVMGGGVEWAPVFILVCPPSANIFEVHIMKSSGFDESENTAKEEVSNAQE